MPKLPSLEFIKEQKDTAKVVRRALIDFPETRNSDQVLLKKINEICGEGKHHFESIRRNRQKESAKARQAILDNEPNNEWAYNMLPTDPKVCKDRRIREEEYRLWVKMD